MNQQHLDKRQLRRLKRKSGKRGPVEVVVEAVIERSEPVTAPARAPEAAEQATAPDTTDSEWDLRAAVLSDPATDEST